MSKKKLRKKDAINAAFAAIDETIQRMEQRLEKRAVMLEDLKTNIQHQTRPKLPPLFPFEIPTSHTLQLKLVPIALE